MSRRIKWGVLGTASIAWKQTIPGMQKAENACLYAIAGRNPEKTAHFQKEFGFEKAYDSLDALLEDENVDAVYIPLPNHMHKEWIMKAARKKKHILCEKPLAPTPQEVEEVTEFCRKEGVILAEAFAYLHSPLTREIIDVVHRKVIGDPTMIQMSFYSVKWPQDNIRLKKEMFGGCTYDLACYNISMILKLLEEQPVKVNAMARFMDNGVDDYCNMFLEFPSGACVSAACGMFSSQRGSRFYIHGTEGILETVYAYNFDGEVSYRIIKDGKVEERKMQVPSNYMLEVEQFGRCILKEEESVLVTNEFSLEVSRLLHRVLSVIGYDEQ